MDEIEAMKAIADKMEKLSDAERGRVLGWALSKYGSASDIGFVAPSAPPAPPAPPAGPDGIAKRGPATTTMPSKGKGTKKAKSIISMDKSLNLSPSGKTSAAAFAAEKKPTNAMQKSVVAVYYLRETLGMSAVTVSAVYTFFKTLSWPVPADMRNALQKAGSEGWLDTKNSEDIKLTSMGENLVEHSLPAKPKA